MPAARNHTRDHIKAIACLTIVCHHLAFYGPMTDVLRPVLPALLQWLDVYGRMAVQVFLVLGGYLAAAASLRRAKAAIHHRTRSGASALCVCVCRTAQR